MRTLNQRIKLNRKSSLKKRTHRRHALNKCPQRKGVCLRVFLKTPRKPNSAYRRVARVFLSTKKVITAYIPGEGATNLQQHSSVLVRGGRTKDLPGLQYKLVRGKYDFVYHIHRQTKRSKYGTPKKKLVSK